jgi:endoglucanase
MHAHPRARLQRRHFAPFLLSVVATIIVIGALTLVAAPGPVRAAGSAFVRVNQVGYATTATKRAYLMASGAETGATFSVRNARGVTIYSAAIGAKLGAWSSSYPDVYALDFNQVSEAGAYDLGERADLGLLARLSDWTRRADVWRGVSARALFLSE